MTRGPTLLWRLALGLLLGLAAADFVGPVVPEAQAQGFGGFVSPGELARDHEDLDKITRCTSCHEPGAGVTAARCLACHETVQEQIDTRRGFHANRDEDCQGCHDDHRGRDFQLVQMHKDSFEHQGVGFALRGKHAQIECRDCHEQEPDWSGLDASCESCHEDPHGASASTRPLLAQCRTCHDEDDWTALPLPLSTFDHNDATQADYALHGQHEDLACEACHTDKDLFVPTEAGACTDCHENPHGRQFPGQSCENCHGVERAKFRLPDFDHDATDFRLDGVHAEQRCSTCHGQGRRAVYRPLEHARCESCHEDVHAGQFAPRDCDACHSSRPDGFQGHVIDHDATSFPLRCGHVEVECTACHGEGPAAVFAGLLAEDCDACHEDIHQARFEPDACTDCHTDGAWPVDPFDHGRTRYLLDGAHADARCTGCHGEGEQRDLQPESESCLDCHAEQDPHQGLLAPQTCMDCHVTADWKQLLFDHGATRFALDGAHTETPCRSCHETPDYRNTPTECSACHGQDAPADHYEGACSECHGTVSWPDASLGSTGHDATGFPLRGLHTQLQCRDCHADPEPLAAQGGACIDCHAADDPHRNLLGDACGDCHGEADWLRTRFNHAITNYALRGSHRIASCTDCHAAGFAGTPTDCIRCHLQDKPDDRLHGDVLITDCSLCHRPVIWDDATFSP